MARRKSTSDIARQSETIRQRMISRYGSMRAAREQRPSLVRRASTATRNYIENIRNARGVGRYDISLEVETGTQAARTGRTNYETYSRDRYPRSVYMGLNNG